MPHLIWDSSRLSILRRGLSLCFKNMPQKRSICYFFMSSIFEWIDFLREISVDSTSFLSSSSYSLSIWLYFNWSSFSSDFIDSANTLPHSLNSSSLSKATRTVSVFCPFSTFLSVIWKKNLWLLMFRVPFYTSAALRSIIKRALISYLDSLYWK